MSVQLDTLQKKIVAFRNARKWQRWHDPKSSVISLMLEAAELAEHFQWKKEKDIARYIKSHADSIGDELVDILYWVLLIAHDSHINLEQAFTRKMKKNALKYPVKKT